MVVTLKNGAGGGQADVAIYTNMVKKSSYISLPFIGQPVTRRLAYYHFNFTKDRHAYYFEMSLCKLLILRDHNFGVLIAHKVPKIQWEILVCSIIVLNSRSVI